MAAKEYEKAQKKYDSVRACSRKAQPVLWWLWSQPGSSAVSSAVFTSLTRLPLCRCSLSLAVFLQGFVHVFFGKEELEMMPAAEKDKLNKIKVSQRVCVRESGALAGAN